MIDVVVGGFFGDEGKGKIAAYLSLADSPDASVRTGSVNAGHTVVYDGNSWKLRSLPSAFVNPRVKLYIAAGALIRLDVLLKEISETGVHDRLCIDRNSGVIEDKHVSFEQSDSVMKGIGSTGQGVGAATADRVLRRLKLANEFKELNGFICDSLSELLDIMDRGGRIIAEGTQGYYLSLYHGTYPYVTSRDTTASAILSEIGLGPKSVDQVIVVFKSYITRVGEGPLPGELDHDEMVKRGLVEKGTVTGRLRRAAPFNVELALRAVRSNSATQIALTKIDALFPENKNVRSWEKLSREAKRFIEWIEESLKVPVTLIGTGEDVLSIIDLRKHHKIM